MLAIRPVARSATQFAMKQAHSGSRTVITGPPSNKMSTLEKTAHGLFMSVVWLASPAYVLVNMRKYRGAE